MPGSSWSLGLQSCLVCFQWIWKDHFTLKRKTGRYEERWACLLAPTNGCPIPTDAQATSGARTIKKMLVVFSFDELVAAFQVTIGLEEQDLCDFFFFFFPSKVPQTAHFSPWISTSFLQLHSTKLLEYKPTQCATCMAGQAHQIICLSPSKGGPLSMRM